MRLRSHRIGLGIALALAAAGCMLVQGCGLSTPPALTAADDVTVTAHDLCVQAHTAEAIAGRTCRDVASVLPFIGQARDLVAARSPKGDAGK